VRERKVVALVTASGEDRLASGAWCDPKGGMPFLQKFPVSAYAGSSMNLKDLKDPWPRCAEKLRFCWKLWSFIEHSVAAANVSESVGRIAGMGADALQGHLAHKNTAR